MPVIADTAYPGLPADPGPVDLEAFTPEVASWLLHGGEHASPHRAWRCWSCSKPFADVPVAVTAHVAASTGLDTAVSEIGGYDDTPIVSAFQPWCAVLLASRVMTDKPAAWRRRRASRRPASDTSSAR